MVREKFFEKVKLYLIGLIKNWRLVWRLVGLNNHKGRSERIKAHVIIKRLFQ